MLFIFHLVKKREAIREYLENGKTLNFVTGFPLGLENLEKWEGIFQSGKSQGILNRLEKSGKITQNTGKLREFQTNIIFYFLVIFKLTVYYFAEMHQIFSYKRKLLKKYWKNGKNTGKVREKSGNFVSPEKWEPCVILFKILGKYKESRKKSMSTTLYISPGRTKCSKGSHSEALNKVNGGCFNGNIRVVCDSSRDDWCS